MSSWIEIGDVQARKLLASYFAQVDRTLAPLSRAEADAVRQELETHILDAMAQTPASEADARSALEQLGDPDEFCHSWWRIACVCGRGGLLVRTMSCRRSCVRRRRAYAGW